MIRAILHFLVLALSQMTFGAIALGQVETSLHLGAGKPGTGSFELGVGITSLIKVRLLPSDGIDLTLVESADRDVTGEFLILDQALIKELEGLEPITDSSKDQLRSIMAFRPSVAGSGPTLEFVVREDVDDDAVYLITKVVLENAIFLEDLNKRSWNLSADEVLNGLSLRLHTGAIRYYEEIGEANLSGEDDHRVEQARLGPVEDLEDESMFILEFSAEDTKLDRDGEKLIAEACQYANVFGADKIQVIGQQANRQAIDQSLVEARMRYVIDALRANTSCASDIVIVSADPSSLNTTPIGGPDQIELKIMLP